MAAQRAPTDQAAPASPASPEKSQERKSRQGLKYPPYVNAYGNVPKLFEEIRRASVPPKFTLDFMETVLGLKSSSARALIPLLKRLGFLDAANVPTEAYRHYRDETQSKRIMASQIQEAYADLYRANEYAHRLGKDQLVSKLRTLTGAAEDDPYIPAVVGTFMELARLAEFDGPPDDRPSPAMRKKQREETEEIRPPLRTGATSLGLSYTINLNLPATTEIEVFNAIFKSLREHLLDER